MCSRCLEVKVKAVHAVHRGLQGHRQDEREGRIQFYLTPLGTNASMVENERVTELSLSFQPLSQGRRIEERGKLD